MSSDSAPKTFAEGTEIEKIGEDVENIRSGSQEVDEVGIAMESSELLARVEVQKTSVLGEKTKDKNYGLETSERSDIGKKVENFGEMKKAVDHVKEVKEVVTRFVGNTTLNDGKEIDGNSRSTDFEIGLTLKNEDAEKNDGNQSNNVNEDDRSTQNTFVTHDSLNRNQNKIEETAADMTNQDDMDSVKKNGGEENSSADMTNQEYESAENIPNPSKDNIVSCDESETAANEESVLESVSAVSTARQTESVVKDVKLDDSLIKPSDYADKAEEIQNSEKGINSIIRSNKNQDQKSILEPVLLESIPGRADIHAADSKSGEKSMEIGHTMEENQIAETTVNGRDSAVEVQPLMLENEPDSSKLRVVGKIDCNASVVEKEETDNDISMMDIDEDTNHDASNLQSHFVETGVHVRIQDRALVAAAQLSVSYITGRRLPDKAIFLRDKLNPLRRKYRIEKERIDEVWKLKQRREDLMFILQEAERRMDLAQVVDLKYGALQEIDSTIAKPEGEIGENLMLTETDGPEEIAEVVSRWTNIPIIRFNADFATKAYKQQEEALAQQQLLENQENKDLNAENDALRNEEIIERKPKRVRYKLFEVEMFSEVLKLEEKFKIIKELGLREDVGN